MKKTVLLFYATLLTFSANLQTILLDVDFQQGIPVNFTVIDNDGNVPAIAVSEYTSAWISTSDPDSLVDTIAASTSYFTPSGTANRWLITPPLNLGAFGNYLSWKAKSHDPSFPDDYLVLVSKSDNQISSFTDTIGYIIEENSQWTEREVDLADSIFANQTIYIAFINTTNDGFKLYLDDILFRSEDPVSTNSINSINDFKVFPNPSSDYIYLDIQSEFNYIEIRSYSGKKILQSKDKKIDIRKIKKGFYFVYIYTNNSIRTLSFIKN